jgi:hypothetical protein
LATQQAPRTDEATESPATFTTPDRLFASLIGLTSLAILLQGLWTGLFLREGEDFDATSSQSH